MRPTLQYYIPGTLGVRDFLQTSVGLKKKVENSIETDDCHNDPKPTNPQIINMWLKYTKGREAYEGKEVYLDRCFR